MHPKYLTRQELKIFGNFWLQYYMSQKEVKECLGDGILLAHPSSIPQFRSQAIHADICRFMVLAEEEV